MYLTVDTELQDGNTRSASHRTVRLNAAYQFTSDRDYRGGWASIISKEKTQSPNQYAKAAAIERGGLLKLAMRFIEPIYGSISIP